MLDAPLNDKGIIYLCQIHWWFTYHVANICIEEYSSVWHTQLIALSHLLEIYIWQGEHLQSTDGFSNCEYAEQIWNGFLNYFTNDDEHDVLLQETSSRLNTLNKFSIDLGVRWRSFLLQRQSDITTALSPWRTDQRYQNSTKLCTIGKMLEIYFIERRVKRLESYCEWSKMWYSHN